MAALNGFDAQHLPGFNSQLHVQQADAKQQVDGNSLASGPKSGAFSKVFALKTQRSLELKGLVCGEGRVKLELDVLQMFLGLRIAFRLAGLSMRVSWGFPFLGMLVRLEESPLEWES